MAKNGVSSVEAEESEPPAAPEPPAPPRLAERRLEERRVALEQEEARMAAIRLGLPVIESGIPIGELKPSIRSEELLRQVLGHTDRDKGEIPFAIDAEGRLFTLDEEHTDLLEPLLSETEQGLEQTLEQGWVIARSGEKANDTGEDSDRHEAADTIHDALAGGLEFRITAAKKTMRSSSRPAIPCCCKATASPSYSKPATSLLTTPASSRASTSGRHRPIPFRSLDERSRPSLIQRLPNFTPQAQGFRHPCGWNFRAHLYGPPRSARAAGVPPMRRPRWQQRPDHPRLPILGDHFESVGLGGRSSRVRAPNPEYSGRRRRWQVLDEPTTNRHDFRLNIFQPSACRWLLMNLIS